MDPQSSLTMDPKMHQIFEPLRQTLEARPYTDIDLFDLIGSMGAVGSEFSAAMALHSRDILQEAEDKDATIDYSCVVAEVYRRTFYDVDHARKYGTSRIVESPDGEAILQSLANNLMQNLAMDQALDAAGSLHQPPSLAQ